MKDSRQQFKGPGAGGFVAYSINAISEAEADLASASLLRYWTLRLPVKRLPADAYPSLSTRL